MSQAKRRKYTGPKIEARKDKVNASGEDAESACVYECVCVCVCVCDVKIALPLSTKLTHCFSASSSHHIACLKCLHDQGQEKLCYLLANSHLCFKLLPSLKSRLYLNRIHLNSIKLISR